MKNLSQEQRTKIAIEEFKKQPVETVGHVAILKLAELGINTNAENVTQKTEATFNGKRYSINALITYKEIKEETNGLEGNGFSFESGV